MNKFTAALGCTTVACLLAMSACDKEKAGPAETAAAGQPQEHVHVHHAPHGGSLYELGEEFAHFELLSDPAQGGLTAYILDGEAEKSLRLREKELVFTLRSPGAEDFTLALQGQASALTGETAGDTSQFAGASPKLRNAAAFSGTLRAITVKGVKFENIGFTYPSKHGE